MMTSVRSLNKTCLTNIWAASRETLSSGFPTKLKSNQVDGSRIVFSLRKKRNSNIYKEADQMCGYRAVDVRLCEWNPIYKSNIFSYRG